MDFSPESPADHLVQYPEELYSFLLHYAGERGLAWDVHAGHGKVAQRLARTFKEVIATHPDPRIIANSQLPNNVVAHVSDGSRLLTKEKSVHLITVGQAYHTVPHEPFLKEVRRVAWPGGIIAVWGFTLPKVNMEFDRLMNQLYKDTLGTHWTPEVVHLQQKFNNLPFPFKNQKVQVIEKSYFWSFADWLGFVESWSAVRAYRQLHGQSPVGVLEPLMAKYWGEGKTRQVTFAFFVKLGIII